MKVDKLEVGRVYKSYKELCEVLDIQPEQGGDNRSNQQKELERYFKFNRIGRMKWEVVDIFTVPLPPHNGITEYIPTIERLILHLLVTNTGTDNRLYIRKNALLEKLKMINSKYGEMKYKQLRLSEQYNIPRATIIDFYTSSSRTLKDNIETALNSLENQSLVQWQNVYTVSVLDTDRERNEEGELPIDVVETYNEYGEVDKEFSIKTGSVYRTHREATQKETEIILEYQREELENLNLDNINEAYGKGMQNELFDAVRKRLLQDYNIEMYYKSYGITFNHKHVVAKYNTPVHFHIDEEARQLLEMTLNNKIVEKVNKNAVNRHNKALSSGSEKNSHRKEPEYVGDSMELTDGFMKVKEGV